MSTIDSFYVNTATNYRKLIGTTTSTGGITTVSTFSCLIRPINKSARLFSEANIGKEYDILSDNSLDVKVGDTIVSSSYTYSVIGVGVYTDLADDSDSYINVRGVKND